MYWNIQKTPGSIYYSPCLQIFNLQALWASKTVILLARTQIYQTKRKNRNIAPSYVLTSGRSAACVVALCCSKTSCAWIVSILKFDNPERNKFSCFHLGLTVYYEQNINLVYYIHNYLKDIYSMSNIYFYLPWLFQSLA